MTTPLSESQESPRIRYCLYARKSSEDDERQALSIESQIKEMEAQAVRDGAYIAEVRRESHSAKASGTRPEFNRLVADIQAGRFDGIITWAADRLSRNAGDLGTLVDLMDQGLIKEIRTNGPKFTNSPSDKFMLMMLCSHAKLENDNKGVNVKRGLRAKVEMGYRPNMAPLGYLHDTYAPKGARRIRIDPVRAPIIKEAFNRVAYEGWSGRKIKHWLDKDKDFTTRKGKRMTLSMVYRTLDNPFYTGRFEFPRGSGKWFQGKHEPIVSQETFDRVQEMTKGYARTSPLPKEFTFVRLMKCGECGSGVSAQEKRKRLRDGSFKRYVYYGCTQKYLKNCSQMMIREEELINQLCRMVDKLEIDQFSATDRINEEIEKTKKLVEVLGGKMAATQLTETLAMFDVKSYIKHILKEGSKEEKRSVLHNLQTKLAIKDGRIAIK